jgi:hypothetical protein
MADQVSTAECQKTEAIKTWCQEWLHTQSDKLHSDLETLNNSGTSFLLMMIVDSLDCFSFFSQEC